MNKKYFLKFFALFLGIFILSGCGLPSFFSVPQRAPRVAPAPVEIPAVVPSVSEPEAAAATSSSQVIREYKKGIDYILSFPAGYFVADPTVAEISCDFAKVCPCVYDANYQDKNDFCRRIAPSSRENGYCLQKWSEGAAGSIYTSYAYAFALEGAAGRCVALQFTKRFVTSCSVYEGNDANVQKCEAEKAAAPGIINNVVSSFKIIHAQPALE
jgi:hypothetical protein